MKENKSQFHRIKKGEMGGNIRKKNRINKNIGSMRIFSYYSQLEELVKNFIRLYCWTKNKINSNNQFIPAK
jgi:hypothetical protein